MTPCKWFFVFNETSTKWFDELIRRSVTSAARFNPHFSAHCIYDGAPTPFTDWLEKQGVTIHTTAVPFKAELFSEETIARHKDFNYSPQVASGAFLKLLIPDFCGPDDKYVLYTDCDTMFLGACDIARITPTFVAAAPEITGGSDEPSENSHVFNSGVMILNVAALRFMRGKAMTLLTENGFFFRGKPGFYDQGLFNILYSGNWERLDFSWNWRAYWKPREDIKILHYHGPKPIQVRRRLAGVPGNDLPHIKRMIDDHAESYRFFEASIAALDLQTGLPPAAPLAPAAAPPPAAPRVEPPPPPAEPRTAPQLVQHGRDLAAAGDPVQAEQAFRRAAELAPDNVGVLIGLSRFYLSQQRHAEALEVAGRAAAANPQSFDAVGHYGYLLLAAGRLDEAETAFRHTLDIRPTDPRAYEALSRLYGRQDRLAEAAEAAEKAVSLGSGANALHLHLAALLALSRLHLRQGRLAEALDVAERASALAPGQAEYAAQVAEVRAALG